MAYYHTWNYQPDVEPFPVLRAERDEFILPDGRRVYDFLSTSFQANFGHSHPAIQAAVAQQLREMPIASPRASFELKSRVTERFCDFVGLHGGKVFYTVSGAEAVENALKMARQITGRTQIAARCKSYHGATLGALSVTGDWRNDPHFTLDDHTTRIPEPEDDPTAEQAREIITRAGSANFAAVIFETISGVNGVSIPPQSWFDGILAICRDFDILLICDEVLCGFGRTNTGFAFHDFKLQPDFVCTSKGITGGYVPFGAVWTGPRVAEFYAEEKLACGLTNYAHPLGLAALSAVLDIFEEPTFVDNKLQLEAVFADEVKELAKQTDAIAFRQRGLLAAIDYSVPLPNWQQMLNHGLHAISRDNMLLLAPPFISTPDRLRSAFGVLDQIMETSRI